MTKKSQTVKPASKKKRTPSAAQKVQPSRRLRSPVRSWKNPKSWRNTSPKPLPIPKARHILGKAWSQLKTARKPSLGITAFYGIGMLLLVKGFSAGQDLTTVKTAFDSLFTGNTGKAQSTLLQLSLLFNNGGSQSSAEAGLYQTILLVVCSLAFIWLLRQVYSGKHATTKLAFYRGMSSLVPFMLVLGCIGLQLLPVTVASLLYSNLISSGLAVHFTEKSIVIVACLILVLWSLRMIASSIFALYIVTLPNMTPLNALRNARQLVSRRRLMIWRKLLFIVVFIILGSCLAVLPFLLFLTPVAVWVFFVISTLWFPIIHSYAYQLYRELLG